MAAVFKDVQDRAMQIAKENAESVFTFAGKISNVRPPQDILTLETQFAQDRVQAFVTQTQQLFSVIEEALQKSERGAHGAGTDAMPSIPMVADFKDVLKFPRFRGHRNICVSGVRNVEETSPIPA